MTETYNFTSINLISDKYDGITLDNSSIPNDVKVFEKELINIIENIKDKKLLWIKLPIEKSHIIPLLTKYNFVFHHCNERDITMAKKLIIINYYSSNTYSMVYSRWYYRIIDKFVKHYYISFITMMKNKIILCK